MERLQAPVSSRSFSFPLFSFSSISSPPPTVPIATIIPLTSLFFPPALLLFFYLFRVSLRFKVSGESSVALTKRCHRQLAASIVRGRINGRTFRYCTNRENRATDRHRDCIKIASQRDRQYTGGPVPIIAARVGRLSVQRGPYKLTSARETRDPPRGQSTAPSLPSCSFDQLPINDELSYEHLRRFLITCRSTC